MNLRAMAMVLGLGACGDDPFTECKMGELTGAWRQHYEETDGDCGRVADNTAILTPGQVPANCTAHSVTFSGDKCHMTGDVECTLDEGGTVREVGYYTQVGPDEVEGSVTVTLDSPTALCRSTYDVLMTRL